MSVVEKLLAQVRQTLLERRLLPIEEQGAPSSVPTLVIVAYSGGADSTTLLHAFYTLREEFRLQLHAAHLHHGMRSEGDQDVETCRALCGQLGIPITVERVSVPELARQWRLSVEEAGRQARYAFFQRLARQLGATSIATAHTRDDQVETILLNLLRGTGPHGLRGIPYKRPLNEEGMPSNQGRQPFAIRPLLDVPRAWTEAYCRELNLPICFDRTNLEMKPLRNRIRHHWLPLLREYAPGVEERLLRLAQIIEAEDEWLEAQARAALAECLQSEHPARLRLHADRVRNLPLALQRRLLRLVLSTPGAPGTMGVPPWKAVEQLLAALHQGKPFAWSFENQLQCVVQKDRLEIRRPVQKPGRYFYPLTFEEPLWVPEAGVWVGVEKAEPPATFQGGEAGHAWIDAQSVRGTIAVRNRRPGDRFQPLGMNVSRPLSEILIDRKWEPDWRDRCPLFTDEEGLLWVPGYTIAERVKITPQTRVALYLYIRSESEG